MVLRCLAALVLCAWANGVRANDDLSAQSTAWNGLSTLVELAAETGQALEVPTEIDVDALGAQDALLLIHPTTTLPVHKITAFLRRGGRVAIVDDYGAGERVLDTFQIARERPPDGASLIRLRDNPALLIARPTGTHPLTQEVRAVTTNHPAALRHAALEPVFTFGDGSALVLAGAVGEGRLIAIADSSVLINNMLELDGNRRLARNLLAYLREGHPGRLVLAVGATPLTAPFTDRLLAPVDALRALLSRLASVVLPPPLVHIVAWLVCLFAFLMAASHVSLKSPYARTALFSRAPIIAGFAGRVAFFRRHPTNLLQPLLAFKIELEAELAHRLGASSQRLLRDVIDDLAQRGANTELVARVRTLLVELDHIAAQEERGVDRPTVSAGKFRDMVSTGERILADIARLE